MILLYIKNIITSGTGKFIKCAWIEVKKKKLMKNKTQEAGKKGGTMSLHEPYKVGPGPVF